MLSDKEKVIDIIKKLPNDISINEIIEILTVINRIDCFNVNESYTSNELLDEIKNW